MPSPSGPPPPSASIIPRRRPPRQRRTGPSTAAQWMYSTVRITIVHDTTGPLPCQRASRSLSKLGRGPRRQTTSPSHRCVCPSVASPPCNPPAQSTHQITFSKYLVPRNEPATYRDPTTCDRAAAILSRPGPVVPLTSPTTLV
nr:hypothetical protein CFP56_34911 [Quercus suber]